MKEDIWGFSDGVNAYVHFGNEFYPINISKDEISFEAMYQPTKAMNTAAIMGGALGGGIAALATKVQKKKMQITRGGSIFHINTPGLIKHEEVKVYIYRPHKKERTSNIEVRNSDEKLLDSFEPGSFLELQPNSDDEVLVYHARIYGAEDDVKLKILPDKKQIYIEVSYSNKSSSPKPVIKEVDNDVGEYYVNRFKHLKKAQ